MVDDVRIISEFSSVAVFQSFMAFHIIVYLGPPTYFYLHAHTNFHSMRQTDTVYSISAKSMHIHADRG